MRKGRFVLVLAVVVVLAGCGGIGGETGAEQENTPTASFTADDVEAPDTVTRDDSLTLTTEITNTGDATGSQQIHAEFGGQTANESVELEVNETEEVNFTFETAPIDAGGHLVRIDTENTSETAEVAVEDPTPYGLQPISVYLDDDAADRNMSGPTQRAMDYWEANSSEHLDYQASYEWVDDRESADIVIEYTDIDECGSEYPNGTDLTGCAPVVNDSTSTPDPAVVEIQRNMSDPPTFTTVVHELGHAHGLTHDDEPNEYMDAEMVDIALRETVKIRLRSTDGEVPDSVREEVDTGLAYFDGHEDLRHGEAFDWDYVDSAEAAHVVITYDEPNSDVCFDSGGGSCTVNTEYTGQSDHRLEGVDDEVIAWHVGYRFSAALLTEIPEDLEEDESQSEREEWPE